MEFTISFQQENCREQRKTKKELITNFYNRVKLLLADLVNFAEKYYPFSIEYGRILYVVKRTMKYKVNSLFLGSRT